MFGVIHRRRHIIFLWVKLLCKVLRLLLIIKIIVPLTLIILLIFIVSGVQARSHGPTSYLMIEKFFSMLIIISDLKNLSGIFILHAETIVIVIVHWVIKGIKIVLTHYLRLVMLMLGLLLLISILSVCGSHTRAARSAPEISVDLLGHLIATRGCSPSSSCHYSSLEVKIARH